MGVDGGGDSHTLISILRHQKDKEFLKKYPGQMNEAYGNTAHRNLIMALNLIIKIDVTKRKVDEECIKGKKVKF